MKIKRRQNNMDNDNVVGMWNGEVLEKTLDNVIAKIQNLNKGEEVRAKNLKKQAKVINERLKIVYNALREQKQHGGKR